VSVPSFCHTPSNFGSDFSFGTTGSSSSAEGLFGGVLVPDGLFSATFDTEFLGVGLFGAVACSSVGFDTEDLGVETLGVVACISVGFDTEDLGVEALGVVACSSVGFDIEDLGVEPLGPVPCNVFGVADGTNADEKDESNACVP
jgi:hypothetical protein